MTQKKPAVFVSYAQSDDQHGELTTLRERLSHEVEIRLGIEFAILPDIQWGQNWQERMERALNEVTFFIPILTPAFFNSKACRQEFERFLKVEQELQRNDLILPIYFVDTPLLNDAELRPTDPLAEVIASRQYADWRELRFEPFINPLVDKRLAQLTAQMRDALPGVQKTAGAVAPNLEDQLIEKVQALPSDKQQEAIRYLDSLANEGDSESNGTGVDRRPIWEVVNEINAELPADTWDTVPADGSINLDHYLYGAPKQQS